MKNFITIIFVCSSIQLVAQNKIAEIAYQGYLTSDLEKLAEPLNKTGVDNLIKSRNINFLYDYLELSYVLLFSAIAQEDETAFSRHVDGSVDIAERILALDKEHAEVMAILSGIYGLKIAHSPMKAMFLGPKSGRYSEQSIETAPSNPVVLLMYGIIKYNTPSMWGGDMDKTIEVLNKTIDHYEKTKNTSKNWKYLHALAWLGLTYEEKEKYRLAESAYKKAILTEPRFEWGATLFKKIGN